MQNDAESLKAYQDVLVRTSLTFYKKTVGSDLELAKMFSELRVIEKEWMEILYPSNVLGNDQAMPLSSSSSVGGDSPLKQKAVMSQQAGILNAESR
jgi:hypothetical protein